MFFNRILILGPPGSGKTTLSLKLSELFNLKPLHLDSIHFNEAWVLKDKEETASILKEFLKTNKKWVIDGNWRGTFDMRLKDADTIIYLDYDFKVYKQGIIERTKKCNGKPRPDIPNCIDRLDESFNKFVDEYEETRGKAWKEKLKQLKTEINIFIFSSREETEEFFERYYKQ